MQLHAETETECGHVLRVSDCAASVRGLTLVTLWVDGLQADLKAEEARALAAILLRAADRAEMV